MEEAKVKGRMKVLNLKLKNLERQFLNFPKEAHRHQPNPGIWSPLQVGKHLQLSESLSIENLEYNLCRISTRQNASPKSGLNLFLMKVALISPLKYKAPASVSPEGPSSELAADSLFRAWYAIREKLEKMSKDWPHEAFSKQVFKHPYAGYLTASQMLRFFEYHFDHHARQISRRLDHWSKTQMD